RYILLSETVIPIPGLLTIEQVDNVVKAATERRSLDIKEVSDLGKANRQLVAKLPPHYQWLKNWQHV
ncbi:MAG: hypothetical protein GY953_44935, partial [bacterium]|nr:hypothetical protein [bacterium]